MCGKDFIAQVKANGMVVTGREVKFKTTTFAKYSGNRASAMLADAPFNGWPFEKSFENDLEEPRIYYFFPKNGLDLLCDGYDKVGTIFLHCDEYRYFDGRLLDVPLSSTRQQVFERLGTPSKLGGRNNDPILGECGAWDHFARLGYSIHVEYRVDADRTKKITLMRADMVPT